MPISSSLRHHGGPSLAISFAATPEERTLKFCDGLLDTRRRKKNALFVYLFT